MEIVGDTALVTGAGTGIGASIARELASHGLHVVVTDVDTDTAEETVEDMRDAGGTATAVRMDVADPDSVASGIETARDAVGAIDILVNNAGIKGPTAPIEDVTLEDWDRTLDVNLRGAFLCCRELVPKMKAQDYGRIVNISSASGKQPVPDRAPYTSSKSGLFGLTKTVAAEGGQSNVNANAVCPGAVEGPRIQRVIETEAEAQGRPIEEVDAERRRQGLRHQLIQPEDVAETTAFLCSAGADRITGQAINVTAGKIVY